MIVIVDFVDLKDNKHLYRAGDKFPRDGAEASEDRVRELMGGDNALGKPLISADTAKKSETAGKRKSKKND